MVKRSGFTLIEMMIVLAIIAALAATLTPIGISALSQARASRVLSDLRAINMAAVSSYTMRGSVVDKNDNLDFGNILSLSDLEYYDDGYYTIKVLTGSVVEVTLNYGTGKPMPQNVYDGLTDMFEDDSFAVLTGGVYTITPSGN